MLLHRGTLLVGTSLQAQHIARVIVDHGQRMASRPVGERQVALEVHLPQLIGSVLLEAMSWIGRCILARLDPVIPTQDPMHGRRHRHSLPSALQAMGNLAGAPGRMLVADSHDLRLHRNFAALGHGMRPARTIDQLSIASSPAREPFVTDIRTDAEPSAELPPVRSFLQRKPNEFSSLIHH